MNRLDSFSVQIHLLAIDKALGRPGRFLDAWLAIGPWLGHGQQHALVRDALSAGPHAPDHELSRRTASTSKLPSGSCDGGIPTRVLAIGTRVEDETNWLVGQLADDGNDCGRARPGATVDEHDAIRAGLHGDVSAVASDHVDVPLHVDDIQAVVRGGCTCRPRNGFCLGNTLWRPGLRPQIDACRPDGREPTEACTKRPQGDSQEI